VRSQVTEPETTLQGEKMTPWEVWASAAKLRADHGDLDGSIQAAMRADALLELATSKATAFGLG